MQLDDHFFMRIALQEAEKAYDLGEIPVGAVIVCDQKVIAKGHNLTERLCDVTAHAEIQAITAAANYFGAKYLPECRLYVTLEPCVMCAGAISWVQIGELIFGSKDQKKGYQHLAPNVLHPKTIIREGIMAEETSTMMKSFFKSRRK